MSPEISEAIDYSKRLGKYCLSGTIGFLIEISLFSFLTKTLGWFYLFALVVSFLIGISIHYRLVRHFVFCDRKNVDHKKSHYRFLLVAFVSLIISAILMIVFITLLNFETITARVITAIIVGLAGFAWHRRKTFASKKKPRKKK